MNPRLPLGIEPALPASREGRLALHRYVEDIVGRFHGRPATTAEVEAALFDEPSADLVPPTGLLLLVERRLWLATRAVRLTGELLRCRHG